MAIRNYRVGSAVTDTPGDIKSGHAGPSSSQYMTFESVNGTDYQVATGKTLYITKLIIEVGTAGARVAIGYGDDGVPSQVGAPTNAVLITQGTSPYTVEALSRTQEFDVFFSIPATKYPFAKMDGGGAARVSFFGIEI